MRMSIEYRSCLPVTRRAELEALMFFNACQERVSACIADVVDRFGVPEIITEGDRLRIRMPGLPQAQSLFALDMPNGRPVGVAVYARQDVEHVTVVHLGVSAEFASGGMRADEQLLLRLLREVRSSTRRMKGVRSMQLLYAERAALQRAKLPVINRRLM